MSEWHEWLIDNCLMQSAYDASTAGNALLSFGFSSVCQLTQTIPSKRPAFTSNAPVPARQNLLELQWFLLIDVLHVWSSGFSMDMDPRQYIQIWNGEYLNYPWVICIRKFCYTQTLPRSYEIWPLWVENVQIQLYKETKSAFTPVTWQMRIHPGLTEPDHRPFMRKI